jgi:hypothetical protein
MLRSGVNEFYRHSGASVCAITYLLTIIVLLDDNSLLSGSSSSEEDDDTSLLHTTHENLRLAHLDHNNTFICFDATNLHFTHVDRKFPNKYKALF